MKPVSLQAVAEELVALSDDATAYINRKNGELFTVSEEEERLAGEEIEDAEFIPDWQKEILLTVQAVLESDDFVVLPDKYEIHEYSIIQRFCLSVGDAGRQIELLDAIRGRGAYRRFKDLIMEMDIQEEWYRFRDTAVKQIAADFLDEQGIAWVDVETGE
jgi:hypothetical protein